MTNVDIMRCFSLSTTIFFFSFDFLFHHLQVLQSVKFRGEPFYRESKTKEKPVKTFFCVLLQLKIIAESWTPSIIMKRIYNPQYARRHAWTPDESTEASQKDVVGKLN